MQRPRWATAASLIAKREQFDPLDNDLTFSEFEKATMKLKSGKAPGITEVPPIAFKLLGRENLHAVYNYVVDFWEGKADYWEWHLGLGVMVPKSETSVTRTSGEESISWTCAPRFSASY